MTATTLTDGQREAWRSAQALWGVQLHDPELAPNAQAPSFAWFTFPPQVAFDLPLAERLGVGGFLESIFAHEIGHHALSPSTRLTSLKIQHQVARALAATDAARIPNVQEQVHRLSNLWSDLLINVRVAELQRRRYGSSTPEMVRMWAVLGWNGSADRLWWVVLRAYEILWVLPAGTLCLAEPPTEPVDAAELARRENLDRATELQRKRELDKMRATELPRKVTELENDHRAQDAARDVQREFNALALTSPGVDAGLLAETVRTFGDDPVSGALRFGMLLAPYLVSRGSGPSDDAVLRRAGLCDGETGASPATPGDLVAVLGDARLRELPEHPALTKARAVQARSVPAATGALPAKPGGASDGVSAPKGQGYGLAQTLELCRDSGANAVIAAWYQTRARSYVRPMLQRSTVAAPSGTEIPGPLGSWDLGDELGDIDWPASLAQSPTVVPGVTTRRREYLPDVPPVATASLDLDLYIDSSGSMVSPRYESPAILAGSILILSVLRGGGRVRVTSFSAAGQVAGGERFTRDRLEALRDLTSYFGGGTVFPLDLYGSRYRGLSRPSETLRRHVVVLSDEGLLSMFGAGQPQYADIAARVRRGLDTATLVLQDSSRSVAGPAAAAGYDVEYLQRMTDAPDVCARLARRLADSTPGASRPSARGGFRG
jgi:hypothetical protein